MSQPTAIYSSIPSTSPLSPTWLATPPNLLPVSIAEPFPVWPNLDWSADNIIPTAYSEVPDYLWYTPVPDPTLPITVQFTRRFTVGELLTPFTATNIPTGLYRLALSVAADDAYVVQTLINGLIISEEPSAGFNFAVPQPFAWRNVKTYVYGALAGITLAVLGTLDIQVTVTNFPQLGPFNPAMFTWILQLFPVIG